MRYYTKEWYHLMQHQHDLSGFRKIPDKVYSDREIRAFYEQDRKAAVAAARRSYNTPPDFRWYEELLQPDHQQKGGAGAGGPGYPGVAARPVFLP